MTQDQADRIKAAIERDAREVGDMPDPELLAAVDASVEADPDTLVVEVSVPPTEPCAEIARARTSTIDPIPFADDHPTVEIPLETMHEIVARGRRATVDL